LTCTRRANTWALRTGVSITVVGSRGLGDGAIVPFGKPGIEDDGQGGFEGGGDAAPGVVDMADNVDSGAKAGGGRGLAHQAHDRLQGVEQHPLTGAAHVGEEAAFNGVVLRAIARIVRHPDFHADGVDQGLEVVLEQVLRGGVAPPQSQSSRIEVAWG